MRASILLFVSLIIFACHSPKEKESTVLKPETNDSLSVSSTKKDSIPSRNCADLYQKAKSTDSIVLKKMDLNIEFANKAIKAFTDFAFYCESDSLSPVFLIKSAQIAISINNANQAKIVLERCISNYPKFRNKPAAIFLLAQLYDEQFLLNNEEEAKKLYEQITIDYPKSEWAANAKGALKLLGKSDEEIIKEFNKKN